MSKFKIYEFQFKGTWLGGITLIVSTSRKQAEVHARKKLDDMGFTNTPIKFTVAHDIHEGSVPYFDDGDY